MTRFVTVLRIAAAALLAAIFIGAPTSSQAASASVRLDVAKAGFIVGGQAGGGVMRFGRRSYRLGIGGVSFGATVGASRAMLVGRAINMRRASDIAGTYGQGQAGLAIVSGGKVARLQNEKGVILELRGQQVGLELALDLTGLVITLQ